MVEKRNGFFEGEGHDLDSLYFSGLEGSGKKQVVANSMHRKDYPYSLFPLYCTIRFHRVNLIYYTMI